MKLVVLAALSTLILDQISKAAATRWFDGKELVGARPAVRLRCVRNRGGLLGTGGRRISWLSLGLGTGAAILLLAAGHPGLQGWVPRAGMGLALGGAYGNLLDRLCRDAVVDFIDLSIWPTFNLADVAIVGGVSLVLWTALGA